MTMIYQHLWDEYDSMRAQGIDNDEMTEFAGDLYAWEFYKEGLSEDEKPDFPRPTMAELKAIKKRHNMALKPQHYRHCGICGQFIYVSGFPAHQRTC